MDVVRAQGGDGGRPLSRRILARTQAVLLALRRVLASWVRRLRPAAAVVIAVVAAMVATLAVPATASADEAPARGALTDRPASTPAAATVGSDGSITIPLRDAVVVVLPDVSRTDARAELDQALSVRAEQVRQRLVAQQATAATSTRTQQVDLRRLRALQEQARRAEAVRKAQLDANRRLQEALEALAKALSSSQCTTVGGQNGTAASISCPLDNGGTGTVSGGGGTSVTPTPTSTPDPDPQPLAEPVRCGPHRGKPPRHGRRAGGRPQRVRPRGGRRPGEGGVGAPRAATSQGSARASPTSPARRSVAPPAPRSSSTSTPPAGAGRR